MTFDQNDINDILAILERESCNSEGSPSADYYGMTLLGSIRIGNNKLAHALIEAGADPNAINKHGRSALMVAVGGSWKTNHTLIVALIAAGADPGWKNPSGLTAADVAVEKRNAAAFNLLIKAGGRASHASTNGKLIEAVRHRRTNAASVAIGAGADPNFHGSDGLTALCLSSAIGDIPTAAALIKAGANPSLAAPACDAWCPTKRARGKLHVVDTGVTPLLLAARTGNSKLVALLLRSGANPRPWLTRFGASPLVAARDGMHQDVVGMLLAAGAS